MAIKCVIIDDDEMFVALLKKLISSDPELEIVAEFNDGMDALNKLTPDMADLIFLDVQMPSLTGIELINSLVEIPNVIMISSNKEYGVEAYENNVVDYLLKPVSLQRFTQAIDKVKANLKVITEAANTNNAPEVIFIKKDGCLNRVAFKEINYIEAFGDYVIVHTETDDYKVHTTMKNIEQKLSDNDFVRVHRSFIIRLDKVALIEEDIIQIEKKLIPVGRSYKNKLYNRLNIL